MNIFPQIATTEYITKSLHTVFVHGPYFVSCKYIYGLLTMIRLVCKNMNEAENNESLMKLKGKCRLID